MVGWSLTATKKID